MVTRVWITSCLILAAVFGAFARPGYFRGHKAESSVFKMQEALQEVLASGPFYRADRVSFIAAQLLPTFKSMPKNDLGHLTPKAAHYMLSRYFQKEHGWTLHGLDPTEITVSTGILQDQVPLLLDALLDKQRGDGLTLSEISSLAGALERLIFDESLKLLQLAYTMNGYNNSQVLSRDEVHEVLVSYIMVYKHIDKNVVINPKGHFLWKQNEIKNGRLLLETSFVDDSIRNFEFRRSSNTSPFAPILYPFQAVLEIVELIANGFGRWQDDSCRVMRNELSSFDTLGSGHISLQDFYSVKGLPVFELDETIDELRELGLLDESKPVKPAVRIANYVLSDLNCGDFSNYYSVCCISTCDEIILELESRFQQFSVAPTLLLEAVTKVSNAADKDLNIAPSPGLEQHAGQLLKGLEVIARQHGGVVPLHGSLFAQWLHFAFPQECPLNIRWPSDIGSPTFETMLREADEVPILQELLSKDSAELRDINRVLAMLGVSVAFVYLSYQMIQSSARAFTFHVSSSHSKRRWDSASYTF